MKNQKLNSNNCRMIFSLSTNVCTRRSYISMQRYSPAKQENSECFQVIMLNHTKFAYHIYFFSKTKNN